MQLLNEMSPEERAWREREKQFCHRCRRWVRHRIEQRTLAAIWSGEQRLPRRRFVNARMRATEEVWRCQDCPGVPTGQVASGMWIDFEHIGEPDENVVL